MTPPDGKKGGGALPPQDLTRLAQRDIGKVARLFRDSGFRYRVFDSETGEHQLVDPVRPLPPMDHVPPVWPPPLSEAEVAPRPESRRQAVAPAPAPAPAVAAVVQPLREPVSPPAAVVPEPRTSPAAIRAEAKTDEIFRAAAVGQAPVRGGGAAAAPAMQPSREQEPPMSSSPKSVPSAPSAARQVARLVAIPGNQAAKAPPPEKAPVVGRPFRVGGPSVANVFDKLMQPPVPPRRPAPSSTAAVLRGLLASGEPGK